MAGIEIKSLCQGCVNLKDTWYSVVNGELLLSGMHISPYKRGNIFNKGPLRVRRLLTHKCEVMRLLGLVKQGGYSLVPLSLHLKGFMVKV